MSTCSSFFVYLKWRYTIIFVESYLSLYQDFQLARFESVIRDI